MDNFEKRCYSLMNELGQMKHENTKLQYELDYLNGVGHVSTAYAIMLINKAINRLNDDIYLQGDVDYALNKLFKAKSIIDSLSYGEAPTEDELPDE